MGTNTENHFFDVYHVLREPDDSESFNFRSFLTCVKVGTAGGNRKLVSPFGLVLINKVVALVIPICAVLADDPWTPSQDSIEPSLAINVSTDRTSSKASY